MDKPLDELYFVWLYSQVGDPEVKNPSRTYWRLLRQLFTKEFVWFIANDDNRLEDGRDLRKEFVGDNDELYDPNWMKLGCSILELLIGLSRRLSFEAEGEPRDWFWEMIDNLGLRQFNDRDHNEHAVEEVMERVIWRTYSPDGSGGIFPLRYPIEDQRRIELWYQLCAYVIEQA